MGGVCGPLPKALIPYITRFCNFSYPIYDLTKNLILDIHDHQYPVSWPCALPGAIRIDDE